MAADPSKALAAATMAFEKAGDTLKTINEAAAGLAEDLQECRAPRRVPRHLEQDRQGSLGGRDRPSTAFSRATRETSGPRWGNVRQVADKLNSTLTPETQDSLKTGIARFNSAATRLDEELADLGPLTKDLGSDVNHNPSTDFGQSVRRFNRVLSDIELLSSVLRNRQGKLNTEGSLQRLLMQGELYDNANTAVVSANRVLNQLKLVLNSFQAFAERVSRDPSTLSRGILAR